MSIYLYNSNEIEKIANACKITANILDDIEGIINEGITTREIDLFARKRCDELDVIPAFLNYQGFPGAVCISVNDEVIHGIPGSYKLRSGDIVGLDFGVKAGGYYGDSARTVSVGNVSQSAKLLMDATKASLYKGIENAVAGNRISDISHAVERYVKDMGYGVVRSFSGHGIGKSLHEEPSVPNYGKPNKGPRIKNGMVFAIEPMINIGSHKVEVLDDDWTVVTADGELSAHFEHTVAIINDKAEILTKGKTFN